MNDEQRRAAFLAYFNDKLKGDRSRLISLTGLTKGRIAQFFNEKEAFGERAARSLGEKLEPRNPDIFLQHGNTEHSAAPLSRGAPVKAHQVSLSESENLPLITWENLKLDNMPQRFSVVVPDDAMDYPFEIGAVLTIERTSIPRPGRVMLVRDEDGNHYVRKITEKRPGHWIASATGRGYDGLDSIVDKLAVVGIVTGGTWGADG